MKLIKTLPFILAIIALLLLGACVQKRASDGNTTKLDTNQTTALPTGTYKKISATEAKALIDGGNVIILDVRTQEEFNQGHIKDATLLPVDDIGAKAATILPDKDAKILVYCRSGNRSATAAKELIAMGYTDVLDFGGINAWTYGTTK